MHPDDDSRGLDAALQEIGPALHEGSGAWARQVRQECFPFHLALFGHPALEAGQVGGHARGQPLLVGREPLREDVEVA